MLAKLLTIILGIAFLPALALPAFAQGAVKIGVLNDMSGPYSDVGGKGSVEALRMAIDDFGGTVLGKPIEVVFADHQNKVDIAANIARQWYDRDGVDMITDLTNSAVAIAVQGIARERRKINLVTATATTALTNLECSSWGVHWTFDAYALSVGTAAAMVEEGGKSWYFISADYADTILKKTLPTLCVSAAVKYSAVRGIRSTRRTFRQIFCRRRVQEPT